MICLSRIEAIIILGGQGAIALLIGMIMYLRGVRRGVNRLNERLERAGSAIRV